MTETAVLRCPRSRMPGLALATGSIAVAPCWSVVVPRLGADPPMSCPRDGAAPLGAALGG